jgi:hypothetical protein
VRFKDSSDQISFLLVTSNGAIAEWNTRLPWVGGLTDGFSPDDQLFLVGYETITGADHDARLFDMQALTERPTPGFRTVHSGLNLSEHMYEVKFYFSPCSDWLARIVSPRSSNFDIFDVEFAAMKVFAMPFGSLIVPQNGGRDVSVKVQRQLNFSPPLEVMTRGLAGTIASPAGIRIRGHMEVRLLQSPPTLLTSDPQQTGSEYSFIDYPCHQPTVTVEAQVQPVASFSTNKAVADAWAYTDILAGATEWVRCLQPWRAVNANRHDHFCVIAEAFTERAINGVFVSKTPATTPYLDGGKENIAQRNVILAEASVARATFTARNPLPFDAIATLTMKPAEGYAQRFVNWPKSEAEISRLGLRVLNTDGEFQRELELQMKGESEVVVEFGAEVRDGSASPAAAAFSVTQALRGVVAGGIVVVVLHGVKELIPNQAEPPSGKVTPVEMDGPARIASFASDPSPGAGTALYTMLSSQRVGVFLYATDTLSDVSVHVESTSHPSLVVPGLKYGIGDVRPKAPFFVSWEAECSRVPAGRQALLLKVKAAGFQPQRLLLEFDLLDGTPSALKRPWYEERFGLAPSAKVGKN